MTEYFLQGFIYLAAAVIAVPIAKKLGLGSVLGYLVAGIFIGPVLGLVGSETNTIQHFAEFGVVMMLFLVGLELAPSMLWSMRHRLLGLGGLQVLGSTVLITGIVLLLGYPLKLALAIGLIFSLSSTAIVLQTFAEKGFTHTEGGRNAFSILLFQDIAVIPILAFIPFLALPELAGNAHHDAPHGHEISLLKDLSAWQSGLVTMGAIVGLVVGGHFLSRPLFHFVAQSGVREIFTATALMLVVGIAALMSLLGLSPALGTFLAGVVLANSEFRHELESSIEPFKGLLLGLFFMTVGAGIQFGLFQQFWWQILCAALGVMLLKALILYLLARLFNITSSDRWLVTLSLAQAGEFGFVLLSFSVQNSVIPHELSQQLALVIALSMLMTPGLFILFDKVILPKLEQEMNAQPEDDIEHQAPVIIAGIGRFGQIVNRMLTANGINTVVLDSQATQVFNVRQINIKAYFGDGQHPELLHLAGIEAAKLFVIAVDDEEDALAMLKYVKHAYPQVTVLARAFDRNHGYLLKQAGAEVIISETYHSALYTAEQALSVLGFDEAFVKQQSETYEKVEASLSEQLYQTWLAEDTSDVHAAKNYLKLFLKLEKAMKTAMTRSAETNNAQVELPQHDSAAEKNLNDLSKNH